jgi:Protein of unknown function (DUF3309)
MNWVIVLIVVLLLFGGLGAPGIGPWNHGYGWGPSGGVGLIVVILIVLLLLGHL